MPAIERHLRVRRTARYYQLGQPTSATREIWVACHGYSQLAAPFAKALEVIESDTRVVVAPEGLSRMYLGDPLARHGPDSPVGASWMTREDRESEIADYVDYLDDLVATVRSETGGAEAGVTALGFSQGGATVCRWAARGRTRIHRLIVWAGSIPTDLPQDRGAHLFGDAKVILVAGRKDRFVAEEAADAMRAELSTQGIDAQVIAFDGGHALNSDTLRRLATNSIIPSPQSPAQ